MYKTRLGLCRVHLHLEADANSLIQAPGTQDEPRFFQALNPQTGRPEPTLPATTFRGVLRSTAERILRSRNAWLACDPFATSDEDQPPRQACSKRLEQPREAGSLRPQDVYAYLCPACRLFGATAYASLLVCHDGRLLNRVGLQKRVGIAIDRFTGGVKHGALFSFHPLDRGTTFATTISINNFALWQIGLLALVIRDLDKGRANLGSGSRKGMGTWRVHVTGLHFRYARQRYHAQLATRGDDETRFLCDAQLLSGAIPESDRPVLWVGEGLTPRPPAAWHDRPWVEFEVTNVDAVLAACVEDALVPMLQQGVAGFRTPFWPPLVQEGGQ